MAPGGQPTARLDEVSSVARGEIRMTDTDALKHQALQWIDDESAALVEFLAGFVRAASPNPPGDTRAAADHASAFLKARGVPFDVVAPQAVMPNVVGTFGCAEAGRHLALNGHIDVYPVTDAGAWQRAPFSGDVAEGRVHGRGAADMKCGTTASLAAYSYLHRLRWKLRGRVSLSVVSDEESGGRWGTEYLMRHHSALIGDCCLNGEPGSPHLVRVGEKGPLWARFTVGGSAGHGGYPIPGSGAIANAARLIVDLERVTRLAPATPPALAAALERARGAMERGLGAGAVETVQAVTINVGTIRGGTKISLRATECVFDADIRLPIGLEKAVLMSELQAILARHPQARMEELIYAAPNMSDPEGEMAGIIQDNVERLRGFRPPPAVSIGGSDARFWRYRGIPAYSYGPTPAGVGASNEYVAIDEFLHIVRTHALSAIDYLARPALSSRD